VCGGARPRAQAHHRSHRRHGRQALAERLDDARRLPKAPGDEDLARRGRADRQRQRRLGRALLERAPPLPVARVAAQRRQPRGEIQLAVRIERAAAEHRALRKSAAEEVGHLGIERAAGTGADRAGRAAEPVDDLAAVDGEGGAEAAAELEHDERRLGVLEVQSPCLVGDAQRGAGDLVRGPEVDAVPLAIGGHRRQMDSPRPEHEREPGGHERAHDRAHPADADRPAGLVLAHEQHQRKLAVTDLLDRHQRQPVAGRADHELQRGVIGERRDEQAGVGADLGGEEAALEDDLAASERTHVERDRPRIDAGHARAGWGHTSSLATS
jgi:hypothetical protein